MNGRTHQVAFRNGLSKDCIPLTINAIRAQSFCPYHVFDNLFLKGSNNENA